MSKKKRKKKRVRNACARCWTIGHMTSVYKYVETGVRYPMCSKCGYIDKRVALPEED